MAWIESHQSLRLHSKTLQAVELLHVDRHKFLGHLMCLWWWGLDQADIDGVLPSGTTPKVLAAAAEWPVIKADRFVQALMDCKGDDADDKGFLEQRGGRYVLHDWYDYAGKYNNRRAANKERMRGARAQPVRDTNDARVGLPVQSSTTNQPDQPEQSSNRTTRSAMDWPEDEDDGPESFRQVYRRRYEQVTGRPIGGTRMLRAGQLEKRFGSESCIEVAEAQGWEKDPNYYIGALEDMSNGTGNRSNGTAAPQRATAVDDERPVIPPNRWHE